MVDIIFSVLIIIIGVPMLINPKKVTEREASKIKSPTAIRVCGIVLIVLAIVSFVI